MIVDECKQIDANNTLEQDHSSSQDAVERNTMDHSDVLQQDHSKSGKGIEKDESDMIVETKMSEEIEKTDVENLSSSTDQMKAEHVEKTDSDTEGESNKNSEDVATNVNDVEVDENSIKIAEKSDVSAEEQLGSTDRSIHTGDIEESNSVKKKSKNVRSLVSLSFEKVRVCELSVIRVANIHEKDSAETESMRSEAMVTDISRPSIVTENDSFITRVTDDVVCEKREIYEAKDKESTTEEINVLKTVDLLSRKVDEKNAYTESEPVEIGILIADQSVERKDKAEFNTNNIKADSDVKTAAKPNKNHLHISSSQSAGAAEMETESEGKDNLTEKETESEEKGNFTEKGTESEEKGNLTEKNSESEGKENLPGMETESEDKGPLIDFPVWPKKFTACPATACSKRKFKEFEDFRNHWYQKHVSHTYFWFCIVCRQTLTKPMQVLEHNLITDHDKEGMVITKLSVPNKHYIDQKGALPYQPDDYYDDVGGEDIPETVQLVQGVKNQKIWPQTAAPCVVPNCPKKLIDTYADFMEHWQAVHKNPYKQVWQCQVCFLRFETEEWALEHKIFCLHQETDITVRKIMARNKAYINPKNNLPYCVGTPAVKCLLEKAFPLDKGENNQAGSQELLKEFQNTNDDPVWPFVPTPCPVQACNKTCFDTISEFKSHWKLVHESSHTVHECLICSQKFSSRSHFNRHQYHQHDGHHQRRKKVEVVNELYVDPKGVRPYWSGIEREKIVSFVENLNKSKASQTTGTVNLRVGGNMIESVLKDFIKTMFETSDTQQKELHGESVTEMGILRDEVVDPGAYKRWPEYNTFPEWPNKPTPCPVPCCDETKYEELTYFMTHWRKFHIPRVLIRKCEICGREGNVSTICHTKTHGGVKPKVKSIVIWNDMYIDPKGNTPYRHNLNSKKAENTDNDLEITQNGNEDQEQHTSDTEKKVYNISIQSEKTRKRSKEGYMDYSVLKKQKVNSDNLSTDSCIETGPTKLKETVILPEKEDSEDLRNRRKNEHLGPLWPDKPTPCHVVGCSNSEKFHNLRGFMSHWQAFHVKVKSVFKCTACQKILKGKMEPKLHIAKKHAGKTDCIKTVWVTNNSYISPGSLKPFRKREIEDTSVEADKELKIAESEQPFTNKPVIHGTDLLDQTVDTHEKETNPVWTGVPSPCRVQACPNTHLFTTLEGYTKHWNWYHEESRTKYKCSRCNVIFDSLAHARKNFEKGHKNCQAHVLTSFQVPNTKFIDPKGIKPYRKNCDVTARNGQVRITDSGTVQTAGKADRSDNGSIEGEGIIGTTTDLEDRKKKGINYKSNIVPILTETPTTCKVEECKNLKPFETQKDYMLHWTSVHEKTKVLFECSLCHERLENQNLIKYHRQMKHAGQEVYFPAVGVLNLHCIDPKNVQPFVKGSPKERNLVLKASIQCKENEHAEAISGSSSRDKGENAEKSSEELQHEKIDSCQYVDSFDKKGNIEDENQELNETKKFPVVTVFSEMHSSNRIENLTSEIAKNNGNDKNRYKYTAVNMELPQTFQPNSDTSLTQFNVMTDKAKTVELLAKEVERDDHIERPVWPNKSSPCQVKRCLKRKWFVDFYEYWRHWIAVHKEYMIRYKCGLCPKKMKDWEQLKHIKNKHMGKELVCTIIKVPNKSYIDPEEVLPYRIEDNANKQQNQRECTTACMNATDEVEGSLDRLSISVLDAEVKLNENQNSGDAYDLPYVSKSTYNKMEMLDDSDFTTELTSKSTCVLSGERPLWPGVPSLCPVTDCQKKRIFETFQCFMSHWKAVHEESRYLYQCSLCQRKLKGAHKAEYHKKAKIHAGENVTMISLTVPNPFYVDPKGALPFRIQYVGERKKLERNAAKALLESIVVSYSIEKNTDQDILDECHDENEMEEKEEAVVQELNASAETDLDLNDMIAMKDLHGVGEPQNLTDAISTTANEKTHISDDNDGTQILKVGAITTDDLLPSVSDDLIPSVTDQHMATDKVKDLTDYKELSYQVQEGLVLEDTLIEGNEDKSMKPLTEMEVAESYQATTSKAHSHGMDFAEQTTETTEKVEGPIWPEAPTCCKVKGCTSTELFPKYWHYMSHWNSTHIETLKVFKCTLCCALFKSLKCMRDHSKAKGHSGGKDFYEILNVPNTRFIDPERVKPYRKKCDGISRSDPHINCVQVPTASADSIKLGQCGNLTTVQISGEGNEYTMDQKLIDFGSKEGEERIRTEDGSISDSVSQNTALLERKVQLSMKSKRPVWPGIPTLCQVDECKNSKPYETFNDYVSHWKLIHEETHIYYQCSLCNQQLESKKHVKHHKQSKHAGKKVFFPVVSVPNCHYIDPKHVLQFGKDASKESHPSEESYSETRLKQCTSLFEQTEEIVRQPVVQETETFELTDRPLWPGIPTPCQVEQCPVKLFIEFEDYWQHWISVHKENKIAYKCSACGKKAKASQQIKHIESKHPGQNVSFAFTKVPKPLYKDPKEVKPYRIIKATEQQNQSKSSVACSSVNNVSEELLKRSSKTVTDTGIKMDENSTTWEADDSKNHNAEKYEIEEIRFALRSDATFESSNKNEDKERHDTKVAVVPAFRNYESDTRNTRSSVIDMNDNNKTIEEQNVQVAETSDLRSRNIFNALLAEGVSIQSSVLSDSSDSKASSNKQNIITGSKETDGEKQQVKCCKILESDIGNTANGLFDITDHNSVVEDQNKEAKEKDTLMGRNIFNILEQEEEDLKDKNNFRDLHSQSSSQTIPANVSNEASSENDRAVVVRTDVLETADDTGPLVTEKQILTDSTTDQDSSAKAVDADASPVWPGIPTTCPVKDCSVRKPFKTFKQFTGHWESVHTELINSYECQLCRATFKQSFRAERHKSVKLHIGEDVRITTVPVPNTMYVDPKGVKAFRTVSIEEPHNRDEVKMKSEEIFKEQLSRKEEIVPVSSMGTSNKGETSTIISSDLKVKDEQHTGDKEEIKKDSDATKEISKFKNVSVSSRKETDKNVSNVESVLAVNVSTAEEETACNSSDNISVSSSDHLISEKLSTESTTVEVPIKSLGTSDSGFETSQKIEKEDSEEFLAKIGDTPTHPVKRKMETTSNASSIHVKKSKYVFGTDDGKELAEDTVIRKTDWKNIKIANIIEKPEAQEKKSESERQKKSEKEVYEEFKATINCTPTRQTKRKMESTSNISSKVLKRLPQKSEPHKGKNSDVSYSNSFKGEVQKTFDNTVRIQQLDMFSLRAFDVERYKQNCPVWPRKPSPCPVEECAKLGNYRCFSQFVEHWKKVHNKHMCTFVCINCLKELTFKDLEKHKHKGITNLKVFRKSCNKIVKPNKLYVDPKGIFPFKISEKSCSENPYMTEELFDMRPEILTDITVLGEINQEKQKMTKITEMIAKNETQIALKTSEDRKEGSKEIKQKVKTVPDKIPKKNLPVWKDGSLCPVPTCVQNHQRFEKFHSFLLHWRVLHNNSAHVYTCQLCQAVYNEYGLARKHKDMSGHKWEHMTQTVVPNSLYIDTEGCLPYRTFHMESLEHWDVYPYANNDYFNRRPELEVQEEMSAEIQEDTQPNVLDVKSKRKAMIKMTKIPQKSLPLWGIGEASCPVPACKVMFPAFETFDAFLKHWKIVHNNSIRVYSCQVCQIQFESYSQARKHKYKGLNRHSWKDVLVSIVPNNFYIDTEGYLPFRHKGMLSEEHWDTSQYSTADYFNMDLEDERVKQVYNTTENVCVSALQMGIDAFPDGEATGLIAEEESANNECVDEEPSLLSEKALGDFKAELAYTNLNSVNQETVGIPLPSCQMFVKDTSRLFSIETIQLATRNGNMYDELLEPLSAPDDSTNIANGDDSTNIVKKVDEIKSISNDAKQVLNIETVVGHYNDRRDSEYLEQMFSFEVPEMQDQYSEFDTEFSLSHDESIASIEASSYSAYHESDNSGDSDDKRIIVFKDDNTMGENIESTADSAEMKNMVVASAETAAEAHIGSKSIDLEKTSCQLEKSRLHYITEDTGYLPILEPDHTRRYRNESIDWKSSKVPHVEDGQNI